MEVSVSFTDGNDPEGGLEGYSIDRTELGRVFLSAGAVQITGPVRIRYEKHPWIERFELDGIKAAPLRRTGIGTKNARGFVKSLATIYSRAYDEYREFGGDAAFDAPAYFGHAAERFISRAGDEQMERMFRKFSGLVENMWREGDEEMLSIAMNTMLPAIQADPAAAELFTDTITEEFREYIREH
ncbi:MAG: hypothetical protein IJH90_06715 [Mogibacterium sp.]|nr:hypothetical protein [Mogibacterium sp.]